MGNTPDFVYAENNTEEVIYFEVFAHDTQQLEGTYISKQNALKLVAELSRCLVEE